MKTVGIDIGGSKITIGIVDDNKVIKFKTIVNDFISEPYKLVDKLIEVISTLDEISSISFIGIGCPGRIDNSVIYGAVNLGYDNYPIARYLQEKTGIVSLAENDATSALIGEILCGSLKKCENGMLLTLGTGVGGGICINRKPYKGSTSCAGEFGHYIFMRNGYQCKCGKNGCFEQYASTSALIREIKLKVMDNKDSIVYKYCEGDLKKITGKLFFRAVERNDSFALSVLDLFTDWVSEGICDFLSILDLEIVAIGGGISESGLLLLKPIQNKVKNKGFKTKVVKASLGNLAGVLGSGNLFKV